MKEKFIVVVYKDNIYSNHKRLYIQIEDDNSVHLTEYIGLATQHVTYGAAQSTVTSLIQRGEIYQIDKIFVKE